MANICLVSCVRGKLAGPVPAKELYTSPLFRKARRFAETKFDRWFILSAKHGLLEPDEVTEPYEKTLSQMSVADRQDWAQSVFRNILTRTRPDDCITLVAGNRYREYFVPLLRNKGYSVRVPLEGLGIGVQLSRLTQLNSSDHRENACGPLSKGLKRHLPN